MLSLCGFALMGVGTRRSERSAATNVAALAQVAFVSFLLAPPLLGVVAQHLGMRWAFSVALPLVMLSLAGSSALAAGRSR